MPTYVHSVAHSGSETLTDQLANTPVSRVGPSGRVQVAIQSAKAEDTYEVALEDGSVIVPEGCHANILGAADTGVLDSTAFIHDVRGLPVGAKILLTIVAAAASESRVAVRT